jgi:hypothetical protein
MGAPNTTAGPDLAARLAGLVVTLLVSFVLGLIVSVQARRRGHSFTAWLAGATLSGNPVLFLVLLALMPDFARKALRRKEAADLRARLAGRPRVLPPPGPAASPAPGRDVSVGDQPTEVPPSRSVGDEETRL